MVGHIHDVAEDRDRPARVRHGRDLGWHHDDQAFGALDDGQRRLGQRGTKVDDDQLLPGNHHVKNAADAVPGQGVDLFRPEGAGQDAHSALVVDDVAAQHRLEIRLGGFGGAGDRSGRDEIREQSRMAERRTQVDEEHLPRILASQHRSGVDRQRRRARPALGREDGDDRCGRPGRGLGLGRGGGRQLLLPQLVEDQGNLLDLRAEALQHPVSIQSQQDGVRDPVDAGDVTVSGSRRGQDKQVAGERAAGQEDPAVRIGDRLLDLSGTQEDDNVAALAAQAQRVPGGQADLAHPARDGPQNAVVQLRKDSRHLQDAHPHLEDRRRLIFGGNAAASAHLVWLFLPRPL